MTYQPKSSLVEPANRDVPIWRYMDFAKFVSLVHKQALFFSRADLLGDDFEGSITAINHASRSHWVTAKVDPMDPKLVAQHSQWLHWVRQWTLVSCWHMNEHESAAMWKLYARTAEAVAVQSTYARLVECLGRVRNGGIGTVQYVNYETAVIDEWNSFAPFMHKRRSFEHERELRVVWQDLPTRDLPPHKRAEVEEKRRKYGRDDLSFQYIPIGEPNPELGRYVPVELPKLVQRVFVAPTAPTWFREVVQSVVQKCGWNIDVSQSSLDAKPLF